MKRIIHAIIACLLVSFLPGCGGPPPEPAEPMPDTSQVQGLEQMMSDDFQSRNFDSMLNRMTSDILILGPDGIVDRAVWRARVSQEECEFDQGTVLEDVALKVLAPTVVLISYRDTPVGTCDGEPLGPEVASSVWVWQDGEWLAAAHHWNPVAPESE